MDIKTNLLTLCLFWTFCIIKCEKCNYVDCKYTNINKSCFNTWYFSLLQFVYHFIQGCKMICCGVDGHGPNKPCVFPFIYKQISYSKCITNDNTNKLWCSTEVDAHGKYNGKWGMCNSYCGTGTFIYRIKVASSLVFDSSVHNRWNEVFS